MNIKARDLKKGDRARMPEGTHHYRIVGVSTDEMGRIVADSGWGTCALEPDEMVDVEFSVELDLPTNRESWEPVIPPSREHLHFSGGITINGVGFHVDAHRCRYLDGIQDYDAMADLTEIYAAVGAGGPWDLVQLDEGSYALILTPHCG